MTALVGFYEFELHTLHCCNILIPFRPYLLRGFTTASSTAQQNLSYARKKKKRLFVYKMKIIYRYSNINPKGITNLCSKMGSKICQYYSLNTKTKYNIVLHLFCL